MLLAWAPFVVRAVQIYVAANFQQASFLAPKAETFREFLDQQGAVRVLRHDLRRRRPDRERSARQRAAVYLSKPLTRAEYVAGKLAILLRLPAGRHVGCRRCCCCSCRSCSPAASRSSARTCSCCRPSRCSRCCRCCWRRPRCWRCRRCRRAAVSSAIMYAGLSSSRGDVQGAPRHHRQPRVRVDLAGASARAVRRRDLPPAAALSALARGGRLLVVVVLIAVSMLSSSGACAASRSST